MSEKIGEGLENKETDIEVGSNESLSESKVLKEECDVSKGREILQKIQIQGVVKSSGDEDTVSTGDKKEVDNLIKESRFGVGIQKVIGNIRKMKTFIGKKMYLLDEVHDRSKLDNKNNEKNK